jgi:hypothetical protein
VVASSAYTLLTTDPTSLSFRAHLLLLLAVAVVGLVAAARKPG